MPPPTTSTSGVGSTSCAVPPSSTAPSSSPTVSSQTVRTPCRLFHVEPPQARLPATKVAEMWTDSHCHLQGETDPAGVIAAAREAGVTRLVCVGTDAATTRQAIELADDDVGVRATAGPDTP